MPTPDAETPKIDTTSILFANVFNADGVELAESVAPDGSLILWALSPAPDAQGRYEYPDHEDPSRPLRYTSVGQRLAAWSPAVPGRCNAIRSDGGHCRMPEGRCRFHDANDRLF